MAAGRVLLVPRVTTVRECRTVSRNKNRLTPAQQEALAHAEMVEAQAAHLATPVTREELINLLHEVADDYEMNAYVNVRHPQDLFRELAERLCFK